MFFEYFLQAMRDGDAKRSKQFMADNINDVQFRENLAQALKDYTEHPRKFAETYTFLGVEGRDRLSDQAIYWEELTERAAYAAIRNQGYRVFGGLLQSIKEAGDKDAERGVIRTLGRVCSGLGDGALVENFPQVMREIAPYPAYIAALTEIEDALTALCERDLIPHAVDIVATIQANNGPAISDGTLKTVWEAAQNSGNAETIASAMFFESASPAFAAGQLVKTPHP